LTLEQALTLPYATQRFVQLGWRVIRLEAAPRPGRRSGDPNRYIGEDTGVEDLHAYYIAPNIGKEAITLDLKSEQGQALLRELIRNLDVDVFMCNTLPVRYRQLGIDYETLRQAKPDLIWCGISAMGPDYPEFAGYDPALQAMTGFMYLTGEPDRDPMLCGLPIIDLKAGDEAFTQVLLALLEREEQGKGGREIHISMVQCAASWLITAMPQLAFANDPSSWFTRSGNEHRSFIPSNCYPTKDGYAYLAIGSDSQWEKLTQIPGFEHLDKLEWATNEGRKKEKDAIYTGIREGLKNYTTEAFLEICRKQKLAVAPVLSILEVSEMDVVKKHIMKTTLPDGRTVALAPAAVDTDYLKAIDYQFACAPRLGEHNEKIFREAGIAPDQLQALWKEKII